MYQGDYFGEKGSRKMKKENIKYSQVTFPYSHNKL